MVSFDYLINDAMGLHARPVGLVVKAVKPYKESEITIEHDAYVRSYGTAGQTG